MSKKSSPKVSSEQDLTAQLFDKMAKRLLHLSSRSVIHCINGLYHANFPLTCRVTYPNTVSVNRKMQERRADMFISVAHKTVKHTYHIEVQTDDDLSLIVRMFEYGAAHAIATAFRSLPPGVTRKPDAEWVINFPAGVVLRWDTRASSPDVLTLKIKFGETDIHDYKVPVFKLLNHSVQELEEQGLLILLPFCVLKFRQRVADATTDERSELAKQLYDIMEELVAALERGERNGFLKADDTQAIVDSASQLLQELYQPYTEFTEVREMVQGAYELRSDKLRKELKAEKRNSAAERRKNAAAERKIAAAERKIAAVQQNAEEAQETLRNLEQLGVSPELLEKARNMRNSRS
jgi:hypothetical protein